MRRVVARAVGSVLLVPVALAALADAQADAARLVRPAEFASVRQLWTGRVLLPDGSPAAGALVVTSAGGRTLSAEDGSFALELETPNDTQAVEVTATLEEHAIHGALVARARLVPASGGSSTSIGLLQLQTHESSPPDWRATFGEHPGLTGTAAALAVHDDGNGPALYVAGDFSRVGGVLTRGVARWDGSRWSALDEGITSGVSVEALASFDDGNGPELVAGGSFTAIGGVAASNAATWDGAAWKLMGSGMDAAVRALTVFDDGSGPALYAGGDFTVAGGLPASHVARWNGLAWDTLGLGVNASVWAFTSFDDGHGPALYAAGDFTTAGGIAANRIAKWDGASWSAVGGGFADSVRALAVFDDGNGPALHAGGILANGDAQRLARWNGATWSLLGPIFRRSIAALTVHDDGGGPALYCGGSFAEQVAKWDGSSWSPLFSPQSFVRTLAVFDDGSGPALHAGGHTAAGATPAVGIGRWDGAQWATLENGLDDSVRAILDADLGAGRALYAGGGSSYGSGVIARFDGTSWSPLGSGVDGPVYALARFDDGNGPALYAGGTFTTAGGATANNIAKWDGASWSALGVGISAGNDRTVHALATFDDGSGEALYVGGRFSGAGGVSSTQRIARWNGTSWSSVGSGTDGDVYAFAVHDDGSGSALYAGGAFTTAGGVTTRCVARWNGSAWSMFSNGISPSVAMPSFVAAFAVYDAGSGPQLYAAGSFRIGSTSTHIARWDGAQWSTLPGGGLNGTAFALAAHDDGDGPALFAGGSFDQAGGLAASNVARFDGSGWSALAEGTSETVLALGSSPHGLRVAGHFLGSPAGDSYVASWAGRRKTTHER